MDTYLVTFKAEKSDTQYTLFVSALDYTKAYLEACYLLPFKSIIISLSKI